MIKKEKNIIRILKNGGVGVMSTDTLYGLVGSAYSAKAVERIYKIKKRDINKPLIVLISSLNDLEKLKIKINKKQFEFLKKVWPGKVSVILPCNSLKFKYLHRDTKTLAVRLPAKKSLIEILKMVGPLVAPSANPESVEPAETVKKAKKYFGDKVDFYLAGGTLKKEPSILVRINQDGAIEFLRGIIKGNDKRR